MKVSNQEGKIKGREVVIKQGATKKMKEEISGKYFPSLLLFDHFQI